MRQKTSARVLRAEEASAFSFDAWQYHPQIPELTDLARRVSRHPPSSSTTSAAPLGIGPYEGRRDEIFPEVERRT